jgi:hypothetical protein
MKRYFFTFLGLAILSAAIAKGTASPTGPIGLQYDEIVRVAAGTTTPPPPGAFEADLSVIMNGSQTAAASPKPAPKKRGLGNIVGAVLSGNAGEVVVDAAAQKVLENAVGGMMGPLAAFRDFMQQGKLERHAFYKGWERVDDVMGKTATIRKCDLHQYIELNLAKKTYRITNPSAAASTPSGTQQPSASTQTPTPEQPGTAVVDFSRKGTALGAQTLNGVETTGYSERSSVTVSKATGSCRNGSFTAVSTEYLSAMKQPRAICPLPPSSRVPTEPRQVVARGGCKPTFTFHNSGPAAPSGRLAMYSRVSLLPQNANDESASQFAFVTERGNVKSLNKADAARLFEIPADFTKEP